MGHGRITLAKSKLVVMRSPTFRDGRGLEADDLTSANQVIPDDWFKILFLGGAKSVIKY